MNIIDGQDINELLAAQAAAEISYELDTELQMTAFQSAAAGHVTWSMTQPMGVNITDHYDSFYATIIRAGNMIFDKTRRASANWMVCGIEVASVIQASRQFTPATVAAGTVGPHYIGTYGGLAVYINPNFGARDFLLGYKGDSLFESGLIYAPYMPILSTDVITLDDFMGRRAWVTCYGKRMVNPLLYITGSITD